MDVQHGEVPRAHTPNPNTDFYRLVANGGSIVHVQTIGTGLLDSVIELLDSSGNRLHSCTQPAYTASCLNDDLDASTPDSALDFKVPAPASTANTFYAHVFDWRGDARPDMQYFLNVSGVIEPLKIMPATLGPGATRGVNFQQQFTATGGTGNVTWTLDGGNFPPGWSINAAGLLGGVATTDGFYTFVIKATGFIKSAADRARELHIANRRPAGHHQVGYFSIGMHQSTVHFSGENLRRTAADLFWLFVARVEFLRLRSEHRNTQRHSSSRSRNPPRNCGYD
jgi:hypothetical protein